jgi:hypothetical protein
MTRKLEEICEDVDFSLHLLGNTYCTLGMKRRIGCQYHSLYEDQNGINVCLNPKYNLNEYSGEVQ